jgi:hypothetical protein
MHRADDLIAFLVVARPLRTHPARRPELDPPLHPRKTPGRRPGGSGNRNSRMVTAIATTLATVQHRSAGLEFEFGGEARAPSRSASNHRLLRPPIGRRVDNPHLRSLKPRIRKPQSSPDCAALMLSCVIGGWSGHRLPSAQAVSGHPERNRGRVTSGRARRDRLNAITSLVPLREFRRRGDDQ